MADANHLESNFQQILDLTSPTVLKGNDYIESIVNSTLWVDVPHLLKGRSGRKSPSLLERAIKVDLRNTFY